MKHKLVVIACLVIVVALGVAASFAWHTESVQQQVQSAKDYAAQEARELHQKAGVAAEKKRINDECLDLQGKYDAQAVAVKKTTPRPVCNLQMVE